MQAGPARLTDQRPQLGVDFLQPGRTHPTLAAGLSRSPAPALHPVGQHDAVRSSSELVTVARADGFEVCMGCNGLEAVQAVDEASACGRSLRASGSRWRIRLPAGTGRAPTARASPDHVRARISSRRS